VQFLFGWMLVGWKYWIPVAIVSVVVFAIAQYLADQFIDAGTRLVIASEARINNAVLLDIVGFLCGIIGVVAVICGVFITIEGAPEEKMLFGLAAGMFGSVALALSLFAFCPWLLNVRAASTASAGEEAVGLASFCLKASLALGSYWYLFAGVWSLFGIVLAIIFALAGYWIEASVLFGISEVAMLSGAVIPLLLYVLFLIGYLVIDIIRSIFGMNNSLQQLANRDS
jgi:hypothetical protein